MERKQSNIYEGLELLPHDLQGWNSTHEVFRQLIEEIRPETIIEVGTWKGASAIHMAKICKELGLNTKIYCVDTWLGAEEFWTNPTKERDLLPKNGYPQIYYQFLSNVVHEGVQDMIIPIPTTSLIGAKITPNADLIYIDASHSFRDVVLDIEAYKDKAPVIFGDDYGNTVFEVKEAVDAVLPDAEVIDNWFWVWKK